MANNEIYLKVKGWFEDKISAGVSRALGGISKMAGKVAQGVGGMVSMFSGMGGELAKVTNGINGLLNGFMALGPVGGVLAGISIAVGWITEKTLGAAEAVKKLSEERLAAMQKRLADLKATEIEKLDKVIAKAADEAERAAKAFDLMASAYLKMSDAANATAAAGATAEMSAIAKEKHSAMMGAASSEESALIGAGYDVIIARRRREEAERAGNADVERAMQQAADDAQRAAASDKALDDAKKALLAAYRKHEEATNMEAVAPDLLKARKKQLEQAQKNVRAAEERQIMAHAQAAASAELVNTAQLKRAAALDDADSGVMAAEMTEADLIVSQTKAAEAEFLKLQLEAERDAAKKRADAEKALADARKRQVDGLNAAIAQQERSAEFFRGELNQAAQELQSAWHLYRNKAAMQAVMDEEKAQKEAEKQWEKDFDRLNSRRRDWRTAENLNVDDRAVREVALAKERKDQAERALGEIAENTRETKEMLSGLLVMKGGE